MRHYIDLAPYTTLRVGGPARNFIETSSPDELVQAVRMADSTGEPLFVLGGGSNVLVGDGGFDGIVVHTVGGSLETRRCEGAVEVTAQAGVPWDDLVAYTVERGLAGIEALSGVPGQIGSAVMQNLGAYGQEAGACLKSALLFDRASGETVAVAASELSLGYRTSKLRATLEEGAAHRGPWHPSPRWIVLSATWSFTPSDTGLIAHPQLAGALGCSTQTRMPLADIRAAVLDVRRAKGMVADPDPAGSRPQYDRWSSGSFFTNPVIDEVRLPQGAPCYAVDGGRGGLVKTSAAWLIEHAGFPKGFGLAGDASPARLSALHTLALTNRGSARASDILELARTVRAGVLDVFGIDLVPETVLVGIEMNRA